MIDKKIKKLEISDELDELIFNRITPKQALDELEKLYNGNLDIKEDNEEYKVYIKKYV